MNHSYAKAQKHIQNSLILPCGGLKTLKAYMAPKNQQKSSSQEAKKANKPITDSFTFNMTALVFSSSCCLYTRNPG